MLSTDSMIVFIIYWKYLIQSLFEQAEFLVWNMFVLCVCGTVFTK